MSPDVAPVLRVNQLVKHFPIQRSRDVVHAVNGVSFEVRKGETLALVGESGSGKTTVGRCILRLIEATAGHIFFGGEDITMLSSRRLRHLRPRVQMVFQEPYDSLNPRFRIGAILAENIYLAGQLSASERVARVAEVMELVRLPPRLAGAYPHELTGSEQQRVSIARALSTQPELLVLDEPTSALDISVRAGIIELLQDLQTRFGVAYLFISHDLTAVREISHRVAVMYLGEIVEVAPNPEIFNQQLHPYSQALLSSVLLPDPTAPAGGVKLKGEIPSPVDLPSGCHLHPRCPFAVERCVHEHPAPRAFAGRRSAACHRVEELTQARPADGSAPEPAQRRAGGL